MEALPNLPVLGPKFKGNKAFGNVKKAIAELTTAQLENAREKGMVMVEEHELAIGDLLVKEKFIQDNVSEEEGIGGEKVM